MDQFLRVLHVSTVRTDGTRAAHHPGDSTVRYRTRQGRSTTCIFYFYLGVVPYTTQKITERKKRNKKQTLSAEGRNIQYIQRLSIWTYNQQTTKHACLYVSQ